MTVTIEKHFNENEYAHEGHNGRVYVGREGVEWLVIVDGSVDSAHKLKREARAAALALVQPQGGAR